MNLEIISNIELEVVKKYDLIMNNNINFLKIENAY